MRGSGGPRKDTAAADATTAGGAAGEGRPPRVSHPL